MSEIYIKRKKQLFAPLNCCFHVFIDDKKQTTLSNGDRDRFKVKKGNHTIKIRNNYFATQNIPFEIAEGEVLELETSSFTLLTWLYFFAPILLIVVAFLKLIHVSMPAFVYPIALAPFVLFIILALTLGAFKKAINIKGLR